MWETETYSLTDLGTVKRGRSRHRPRDDNSLYGGEYPFVQTGDIKRANFYLTKYTQTYNDKGLQQSKMWGKGTLCITIAANIAETAILGIEACFPDSIVGFIPYEDRADVRYIKYYFDIFKKQMQVLSLGATQDNFSVEKMLSVKFIIPQLPTQNKIADILSAYDDLIENNNCRIEILEQAVQQIYKEWFVRFRFPGYETTHFTKGIPDGWEVKSISQIADITDGTHDTPKPVDTGYYLVTGKHIIKDTIDFSSAYYISEKDHIAISKRSGLERGNILFSNIGTIGSICIIGDDTDFSVKNVIIIKPFNDEGTCFLYCLLKNTTTQEVFKQQAGGSSQQFIALGFMRKYKALIPDSRVLENFVVHVKPILNEKSVLQTKNLNLVKQRDQLRSRLMSGKLEI
ncbi:restriction endonuclease subunit S [Paenibacillus sp. sgz5001063]|uniref:restriction endonuclease subunit S n=1 Tax=Paenibacillus sp. sgz5001063 TaxID=3242474 RepID=UPI0036D3CEA0